ncbi:hypothetical protein HanPI659440_Chr06g0248171 [Helianthus annuus]|nr:hypothetical protein HanPI659440_Chr06g0248171 [Helianthus annuus]
MIDLDALKSVHLIMNDIYPGMSKVQYLGGLSVLISFEDEKTTLSVLEAAREVIGRFSKLDVWMGQAFGFERLARLKLTGLPLQLISREVIDLVGNSFGMIVHWAARSDFDDDLSYDYIGVLVGEGKRINESVSLVWRDKKFSVWVAEETGDWVPEFYKILSKSETESESDADETMEVEKDTDANEDDEVNPLVETVTDKPAPATSAPTVVSPGPVIREEEVFLVTPNQINDVYEAPTFLEMNEEVNVGMEEFVPGNQFVFEDNLLSDTDNVDPSTLINKRKKKSGLGNLGRPNPAYSSSLEKTKVGKKPKCNDDLFGLDSLLGLDTEALDDADVAHIVTNGIDLNSQPGTNGEVRSVTADQPLETIRWPQSMKLKLLSIWVAS